MRINVALFIGCALAVGCGGATGTGDGGTADGGPSAATDAGTGLPDAGSALVDAGVTPFNGCTDAMFVDATSASNTVISFGNTSFVYSPACVTIGVGKTVTFDGSFDYHPLKPGTPANGSAGSPNTPIVATSTGTGLTIAFATAGDYPYFCVAHVSNRMFGVIRVR